MFTPACALATPRLAYVTPSHQFPTGVVLPLARRLELLDWAGRSGAFVIEDDYDSEYRYAGRPLQALAGLDVHGRVIYVGTFSKLMFPALRLGYLVLPEALVDAVVAAKNLADTGSPSLEQLTLADFIREGHLDRHLHRSVAHNASRRTALLEAVRDHFGDRADISGAATGLHVLVWLRNRRGEPIASIVRKAEAAGVAVYPVAPFYLSPPRRSGVLLGYGPLSERQSATGSRGWRRRWIETPVRRSHPRRVHRIGMCLMPPTKLERARCSSPAGSTRSTPPPAVSSPPATRAARGVRPGRRAPRRRSRGAGSGRGRCGT